LARIRNVSATTEGIIAINNIIALVGLIVLLPSRSRYVFAARKNPKCQCLDLDLETLQAGPAAAARMFPSTFSPFLKTPSIVAGDSCNVHSIKSSLVACAWPNILDQYAVNIRQRERVGKVIEFIYEMEEVLNRKIITQSSNSHTLNFLKVNYISLFDR
jgi:hypothetical protein